MGGMAFRSVGRLPAVFLVLCVAGALAGCGGDSPAGPRGSENDGIAAIAVSPGSLAWTRGAAACGLQVDNAVAALSFTVTLASAADSLTIGGLPAVSGQPLEVPLAVGANPVAIVARAAGGDTTGVCTVTVLRLAEPGHATLFYLVLSAGNVSPSFTPGTTAYTAELNHDVDSLVIRPFATAGAAAAITVNGVAVVSGEYAPGIPVADGDNTITIAVTAEDGVTTTTYTIVANRLAAAVVSSSPAAAGISCYSGYPRRYFALTPAFDPEVTSYTIERAASGDNDFMIDFSSRNDAASISVTFPISGTITQQGRIVCGMGRLDVGSSWTFRFLVTAPDGSATREYLVTVNIVA